MGIEQHKVLRDWNAVSGVEVIIIGLDFWGQFPAIAFSGERATGQVLCSQILEHRTLGET